MKYRAITSALLAIALLASTPLYAEETAQTMTRSELASYLSGRINQILNETSYETSQYCDEASCDIVVDR